MMKYLRTKLTKIAIASKDDKDEKLSDWKMGCVKWDWDGTESKGEEDLGDNSVPAVTQKGLCLVTALKTLFLYITFS